MSEQSTSGTLPIKTLTPENIALAVQNIDGAARSMDAMIQASARPENEAFADRLLDNALRVYDILKGMDARSPV